MSLPYATTGRRKSQHLLTARAKVVNGNARHSGHHQCLQRGALGDPVQLRCLWVCPPISTRPTPPDTAGRFYVAFIYIQKGIQVLSLQWRAGDASAHLSISIALLVLLFGYLAGIIGESSLFKHPVRVFLKDYGTPLAVIFFTAYQYIGKVKSVPLEHLPIGKAFSPTAERGWLIHFWDLGTGDIFLAMP